MTAGIHNRNLIRQKEQKEVPGMDAEGVLAKVSDSLSVRRAFGTAYERDGMLIIPVALVVGGGGGGASPGRGPDQAAPAGGPEAAARDPWRPDAGGGFGGLVLPSGTYVVQGDRVRWVPAVDVTVVAVAALVLARVVAGAWIRRGHRGRS